MTLQQLKYVVTVAEKKSINEAAKSLFISQPSLSNALKDLEKELGITIFKRTNKGVAITSSGEEFLGYARQLVEQCRLVESKYLGEEPYKKKFSVTTQHYSFAVDAFATLVKKYGMDEYAFSIKETKTYEIIEDVKNLKSEIGILYMNSFNETVIKKIIRESNLEYRELFTVTPHILCSVNHPLAKKKMVKMAMLQDYPYLCFEQGDYNSFHFSEEIVSTYEQKRSIRISDRATLFELLRSIQGFTICTGMTIDQVTGSGLVTVPFESSEEVKIVMLQHQNMIMSPLAKEFTEELLKFKNDFV